ncbi:hypothetical protein [Streptomyces reniochalinae]|uniref:hypothetical protein n=1 Tax=Streptomyces reniochalinae TaxID=2250578 RepID=UPI0011C07A3F|nr:hypothetical protein [Streptomyces reniochalinae]
MKLSSRMLRCPEGIDGASGMGDDAYGARDVKAAQSAGGGNVDPRVLLLLWDRFPPGETVAS